jgi:hypothetical protein
MSDTEKPKHIRDKGWYIILRSHDNACIRGPYKCSHAAGAVREEMERGKFGQEGFNLMVIEAPDEPVDW